MCMYVHQMHAVPEEARRGEQVSWKWNYIDDCNRWMLELDPGSSAIAASAINHRDMSSPLYTQFGIQGCCGVRLVCLPVVTKLELEGR